jgi:choline dehydrogenase-like flavoprotein
MTSPLDPERNEYPDESLADGSVVDGDELVHDVKEEFDYVVVGSGAAGAVAAHVLAASGASVAIVEEGPWVKTREFGDRVFPAFKRMFRGAGLQVIEGRSYVPLLQGRCVGGSTVMNSAIAHRMPEDVLDDWSRRFGLGEAVTARALEPHFEALERELSARAVDEATLGENSRLFLREASQHQLPAGRMQRYETGCRGSARCFTGCPHAAKQGMNVSYVPKALALGARIYTSCRVERILVENAAAVGVRASAAVCRGARPHVELRARRGVVVAASTVQTPNVLRRSGLRANAIGRHFQCHAGYGIGGVFDAPVEMSFGATQGAESLFLRPTDKIKLESISMPPELAAVRIPGIGSELMRRFTSFSHLAVWAIVVQAEAQGTVRPAWRGGGDKVRWSPSAIDVDRLRRGVALLSRMMFEIGAREVWPGTYGVPQTLRSIDEVRLIDEMRPDARCFSFIASHLFGAARMGPDARNDVVGLDFESHEVSRLFVVDSSVFPTNLGVNPQHSIMAISRLAATKIADRPSHCDRAGRLVVSRASSESAAA